MTMQEATYYLLNKLKEITSDGEAGQITDMVMEHITGSGKAERMVYKKSEITAAEEKLLYEMTTRLLQHEPVQYVTGEAWFCGFRFYVDKNVLIPRPETEELVEWVISNCKFPLSELSILDIGTGSGCIPISLKRRLRKANVSAVDISKEALAVAQKNADTLGTDVQFTLLDILDEEKWASLPMFDIITSNPPYVPEKDKATMQPNVLQYEPAVALFVPDDDALLFYRTIARFAKQHLNQGGQLYVEIHEDLGEAVIKLLEAEGFYAEIKKDMQQKDRMVRSGLK
ncbi:MAG: peptide chain release factor N(5)-glutamine methyltransferase [Chitinophagaceae bacterium]|nr:peptide chain release factor N(5)-glutamine methyltransferase [Chitinophagaceae bacterium]